MSQGFLVLVRRLEGNDLPVPRRATHGSSGFDLAACVTEPVILRPGTRALIPTGFCVAVPEGYEAQIRPRSGLAWERGVTMLNSPGTIDSDYRGEVRVIAVNLGAEPVTINRGDRIAQMIFARVEPAHMEEARELPETGRGAGGFGSSGTTS